MNTPVSLPIRVARPLASGGSDRASMPSKKSGDILFKKIERQIKLVFILSVALCLAILSIISYITIQKNSIRNILQLSAQYTVEQLNNFQLHLDHIRLDADNLLTNPHIKARLHSPLDNSDLDITVIKLLTAVQSSNLNITAVTLYNSYGLFRQSESNRLEPYTPPPLKQLLTNPVLDRFVHSKQPAIWLARHKGNSIPADIVNYYRLQRGVYTLVLKIGDQSNKPKGQSYLGHDTYGLILIDVDLSTIFTKIFYNTSGIETYIVTNDDKILDSDESGVNFIKANFYDIISKDKINRGPFITRNRQTVLTITKSSLSSDRIVLAIPLTTLNLQLLLVALLLVLLNGVLITLAALVGNAVAKSIVVPLTSLYQKMKS